jgi:shikimate dehydrogenase
MRDFAAIIAPHTENVLHSSMNAQTRAHSLPASETESLQRSPDLPRRLTGETDVFMIIGSPVQQAKAPEAFDAVFGRFGIPAVVVPAAVPPAHLTEFVGGVLRADNIRGLWVTIPHKSAMRGLLRQCDRLGEIAGAVNAVRREPDGSLTGALFDGEGFVAALDHDAIPWQGKRTLLIGAGGAGAAIAASLACGSRRVGELCIFDPQEGRASALAQRLGEHGASGVAAVAASDPQGYALVINASPLGMDPADPLPCDPSRLDPAAAFVDILMKNQPTPAVQAARARGLLAQTGFEMMIQQAPMYLDFFGFPTAASALHQDSNFLRDLLIPPAARVA